MDISCSLLSIFLTGVSAFWDTGTTTPAFVRTDANTIRQSRFRWQRSETDWLQMFYPWWDWYEIKYRRRLFVIAGITHEFVNLSTAVILNRRTLITSANYLDPYMGRQRELRVWALGRIGDNNTPFRYRVWRITRLFPRSVNPEHQHGPFAYHSPRHDVAIIHTLDQMYVFKKKPTRFHYATRAYVPYKSTYFWYDNMWFAGSGFEYAAHTFENYKIFYSRTGSKRIVDCSQYLPKWWGKFICMKNFRNHYCVQNGGGLFEYDLVVGIGCFEIRYNEDRILAFTDLRYYVHWIYLYGHIYPGEYYEYAYPQWSVTLGWFWDSQGNSPYIPTWQIMDDMYPMGKKKR